MSRSTNYYASLIRDQKIAIIPTFTLESGITLDEVPVAYSTWGTLNDSANNVLVICHALTGSSDALDWWRPLMGPGNALDYTRYFIFCANVLGSPYGTASSLSINPLTGMPYGPSFPDTTIRDDVRIHKLILNALGVKSIADVIGGSMGGMHTLEWPLCTPQGYVKNIIPIATSVYQGAWGISWGEAQRQAISTDATFRDGWYDPVPERQPRSGLGTARMIGMLTYRSFGSFEARFGRETAIPINRTVAIDALPTPPLSKTGSVSSNMEEQESATAPSQFSAQSYLKYQADKFLHRFDANCYVHLTKKMDRHDVTRGRRYPGEQEGTPTREDLTSTLSVVPEDALVVGVRTDLLFPVQQQMELAQCLPKAKFRALRSGDGHDGFLLEFDWLGQMISEYLQERCGWVYEGVARILDNKEQIMVVDSVFGEAEGEY